MYAPPMPLEQPPMVDRPGVRALRGARPQMTPEMQRMRDWANSQRTATAANARNGDFILSQGPDGPPAGVSLPTQLGDRLDGWMREAGGPSGLFGDWRSAAPSRPGPNGPGGPSGLFGDWRSAAPGKPGMLPVKPGMEPPPPDNARNGDFILNPVGSGSAPMGVGIPTQMPVPQGPVAVAGDREDAPGKPMPPVKPGMLPVKPGMEPPPPDKVRRLTGRRG